MNTYVGVVAIATEGCRTLVLECLCVCRKFRGRGIGHDMLAYVTDEFKTFDLKLTVDEGPFKSRLVQLYEVHGFVIYAATEQETHMIRCGIPLVSVP